jgi:hydrogenase-4 component F
MGFLLWIIPVVSVPVFAIVKNRRILHAVSLIASALMLPAAGFTTAGVLSGKTLEYSWLGGIFYLDALSVIILDIVLIIGFLAAVFSVGYVEEELKHGKIAEGKVNLYYMLMYIFMFTMVLALSVRNMGVMWIAIEATTLASAFLVGFYNDKQAIEATWKYVIICSVDIAIAMLGIIFLHMSSSGSLEGSQLLSWTELYGNAGKLNGPVLRLAFIFILIGFGTKAGLAPMHTWLPDAHSQAPSPISALLSGVLLNSAMYAIIRTVSIVNRNQGSSLFTGRILIAAGILSIVTAAIFILTQKDYKRLLAYSSIEHMGIIAVAVGLFTPAAIFGALFHMINHSFTKSMLFLSSGSVLQKYGTREISKVNGLLKALPVTGTVLFLGLFAIAGTPPFSVFASEFNIIAAVFDKGNFLLGSVLAVLFAVIFAGIASVLFRMFWRSDGEAAAVVSEAIAAQEVFTAQKAVAAQEAAAAIEAATEAENRSPHIGRAGIGGKPAKLRETNIAGAVVIVALLAVTLAMGLYMPAALRELLENARQIIIGG